MTGNGTSEANTDHGSIETERGDTVGFGPFEFQVPDRDCQITDCGEKADGVVDFDGEDRGISCCIDCAPQFLDMEGSKWTPLAGGRSLQPDTAQEG